MKLFIVGISCLLIGVIIGVLESERYFMNMAVESEKRWREYSDLLNRRLRQRRYP